MAQEYYKNHGASLEKKQKQIRTRIQEIRELEDGWWYENGVKFKQEVCQRAEDICLALQNKFPSLNLYINPWTNSWAFGPLNVGHIVVDLEMEERSGMAFSLEVREDLSVKSDYQKHGDKENVVVKEWLAEDLTGINVDGLVKWMTEVLKVESE